MCLTWNIKKLAIAKFYMFVFFAGLFRHKHPRHVEEGASPPSPTDCSQVCRHIQSLSPVGNQSEMEPEGVRGIFPPRRLWAEAESTCHRPLRSPYHIHTEDTNRLLYKIFYYYCYPRDLPLLSKGLPLINIPTL